MPPQPTTRSLFWGTCSSKLDDSEFRCRLQASPRTS